MPLETGSSKEVIGRNIATEMHAGKPQKQSIAIAFSKAGLARKDACPQHGYMDACRRGDAIGMGHCSDAMLRGRIVR